MECSTDLHSKISIQDDDVALARLLQEQERALYMYGRPNSPDHVEEEELSDEELARRLQEEEDQAAYQAMAYGEIAEGGELLQENASIGAESDNPPEVQEQSSLPFSYEDMLALGDLAGKVSKGVKEDVLRSLPVTRVCNLREAQGAMLLDRCCICQLEFEDEDEATPLPCRHCYHSDCVKQWLQQNRACPMCGTELELTGQA